jgi:hypothetical protein
MIAIAFTALLRHVQTMMANHLAPAMRTSLVPNAAWNRLSRLYQRFAALHAKWLAGTLPTPRPSRKGEARTANTPDPSAIKLPRHFAWLNQISPVAGAAANNGLRDLLATPEMREFLAACPQAGRYLRPLAHACAMKPDEAALDQIRLPPRPPRKRAPRPKRPKPQPAPVAAPPPPAPTPETDICLVIHGMPREEFYAKTRRWRFKNRFFEV